jgi:hypothetical protein
MPIQSFGVVAQSVQFRNEYFFVEPRETGFRFAQQAAKGFAVPAFRDREAH